jgi:two-component system chemotaxis sensor kinase CheA
VTEQQAGLRELLAGEIARHLGRLEQHPPEPTQARAALHALRGSAAMAQEHELSLVISQLSAAIRRGYLEAIADAATLLRYAERRLGEGQSAFATRWPEPPPLLGPSELDPRYRAEYLAAMHDRLAELDAALSSQNKEDALERAYRSVHAMKGAASSVGDDATAWYCHGLENQLRAAGTLSDRDLLVELARHRAVLALLLEQPADALEMLRSLPPPDQRLSRRPSTSEAAGTDEEVAGPAETWLHISPRAADSLLEHLEGIRLVHDELRGSAHASRDLGVNLRELRTDLLRQLRVAGPPRTWPAPEAALSRVERAASRLEQAAETADGIALVCRRNAEILQSGAAEMRTEVAALRRTTLRWLFDRVAFAVQRLAATTGRRVGLHSSGGDLPVDRRVAARLLEAVLQLVRNAMAHGIEPAEARIRAGKPPVATIWLRAERLGDWLRLVVEDDGSGVDVERIRALAVQRGAVSAETARSAHEDELLALLFLPGLTTQQDPDLLAGRGVGLDLAQGLVRRLGGSIRLARRSGSGLAATIEVPGELGMVEVLWLACAGHWFALPVGFTGKLAPIAQHPAAVALASCLGLPPSPAPTLTLELDLRGVQPIPIGVNDVGNVEEACIRSVPPLVAAAGPYCGAILRSDGSLRLVLDAALLAARAWARAA